MNFKSKEKMKTFVLAKVQSSSSGRIPFVMHKDKAYVTCKN